MGFFGFWGMAIAASALTMFFYRTVFVPGALPQGPFCLIG